MTEKLNEHYGGLIQLAAIGAAATGVAVAVICQRAVVAPPVAIASFFWLVTLVGIGVSIEELKKDRYAD